MRLVDAASSGVEMRPAAPLDILVDLSPTQVKWSIPRHEFDDITQLFVENVKSYVIKYPIHVSHLLPRYFQGI